MTNSPVGIGWARPVSINSESDVFVVFLVFRSPFQKNRFSRMEHQEHLIYLLAVPSLMFCDVAPVLLFFVLEHRVRITSGERFRGSSTSLFFFRLFEYFGIENVNPLFAKIGQGDALRRFPLVVWFQALTDVFQRTINRCRDSKSRRLSGRGGSKQMESPESIPASSRRGPANSADTAKISREFPEQRAKTSCFHASWVPDCQIRDR